MSYVDTGTRSFVAAAARADNLRVYLNAGVLTTAGATEQAIGVQKDQSFAATDPVAVRLKTKPGTIPMVASEAITAGAYVYAAAGGKVGATGTIKEGIALTAAALDGDLIEVLPVGPTFEVSETAINLSDDGPAIFGTGSDAYLLWSTGDASDHSLVLALGDTSQMLHITDKAARASDWAITSPTHPTVYVHSNTTPITDYLAIGGHDGSVASIDMVGGATLKLGFDGLEALILAETASAVNEVTITNAATTGSPAIAASGGDTDITLTLSGKGTGAVLCSTGVRTKQAVTQVHDTTPTDSELDTAFGAPTTLGRGFIGTVDDNDGDTNGYICWTSDASWYFVKGTKAA